jgi:hypothetical protein
MTNTDKIEISSNGAETSIWVRHSSGTGSYLGKVTTGNGYIASCQDVTVGSYGTKLDAIKAVTQRCGYAHAMLPLSAYN